MNRIVIALLKPFSFIPAILMMSLIFSFSSQNGTESSQLSEKVARGIFITINHVMDADGMMRRSRNWLTSISTRYGSWLI